MKIRHKTILAIVLTLVVLFAILMALSHRMLTRDFLRLEELAALRSAERLQAGIETMGEVLRSQTGDWAHWDETYAYVQGDPGTYEDDNLSDSSIKTLALNLVAFLDASQQVVFATGFDFEKAERQPLPAGLDAQLHAGGFFTTHDPADLEAFHLGIVNLDQVTLLLASRPILTSQAQGPIAGTLVFGRCIDSLCAAELSNYLRFPVQLLRPETSDFGTQARTALDALAQGIPVHVDRSSPDVLHGYTLLRDYRSEPALLARFTMPREILAEGRRIIARFLAGLLLSGLVLGVVMFIGLQTSILARLARLARGATVIRSHPDEAAALEVRGNDEISALGLALNEMLEAVQKSRAALAGEKEQLAVTLRSIGDGVIATDREGRIRLLNKVAENLTGWTLAEARARPLPEVFRILNAQTRAPAENPVERSLREGVIVGLANHTVLVARDGREHQIADSCAPIRDTKSQVIGAVLVFRDVTDDYGRREALKAANQMLEHVMNNIPQFIFWKDRRSVYLGCNDNYARIAGLASRQDIAGKTDFDLAWPREQAEFFRAADARVMSTGVAEYHLVEPQLQANGRQAWLDTNRIPLLDARGRIAGILGTYEDITERRQLEEAQRRARSLESLGRVAGGIAHDFNNLLMGVFGNIELAELDLSPGHPSLAALQAAHQALDNARHLTSRLLTFAKGGNPVLETVDLRQRVCDTVRFHLAGSNVAARFEIPADLWPAKADKGQMADVISNLTLNAKEAMPAGGTFHVRAENVSDLREPAVPDLHGPYVQLVFRDEGVGIPANLVGRIFDPYFTTKKAGSGLGLAIVHGIVSKHNGHIRVESTPGVGSTFTVFLPADVGAQPAENKSGTGAGTMPRASGRILLMDDEEVVRSTTSALLVRQGYVVETAADGREAIAKFTDARQRGRPFDLTIMDLTIPGGMGGKEAIGELLALDPAAKVLVSSGYSSDPVLANCRQYGFAGHLAKPFMLQELHDAIVRAMPGA